MLLERKTARNQENGGDEEQQIQGNADFQKVGKAITTGGIDHGIGLVAYWRGKTR